MTFDNTNVVCFAAGTMIMTKKGQVAVEDLCQGDLVLTCDNGFKPISWVGNREFTAAELAEHTNLRPVRIRAGALGNDIPMADLTVSPQHRVMVSSPITKRMFDSEEVLVPAKSLVFMDGIDYVTEDTGVIYFHILFDQHEVIWSNGAPTESLFTGPEALKTLPQESLDEIFTIFPELTEMDHTPVPSRQLIKVRSARKMAMRHMRNNKPLLSDMGMM